MSDTDTELPPPPQQTSIVPPQKWEDTPIGLDIPTAGTDFWEPGEDEGPDAVPPGKMPYIQRKLARSIVGDGVAPASDANSLKLERAIREGLAKQKTIRLLLASTLNRIAQMEVRAAEMASLKGRTGLWSRILTNQKIAMSLMAADDDMTARLLALRKAAGFDIGEAPTPEDALVPPKEPVVDPQPVQVFEAGKPFKRSKVRDDE